jgi:hypothetical protein
MIRLPQWNLAAKLETIVNPVKPKVNLALNRKHDNDGN